MFHYIRIRSGQVQFRTRRRITISHNKYLKSFDLLRHGYRGMQALFTRIIRLNIINYVQTSKWLHNYNYYKCSYGFHGKPKHFCWTERLR